MATDNKVLRYEVNTFIDKVNNLIIQESYFNHNGIREQIIRKVFNLMDEGIRNALIELGWTPPKS